MTHTRIKRLKKPVVDHIEKLLSVQISGTRSISGGDISEAYLVQTQKGHFFCKVNNGPHAFSMFLAEKKGLEAISQTATVASPKVLGCEKLDSCSLLVLEYIESKSPSPTDMERFGHQLADLHSKSSPDGFGWESDNFIGSLHQSNKRHLDWSAFYVSERLVPQLMLARARNLLSPSELPSEESLLKRCQDTFPKVRPALLHGDLWGGNYLIAQNGTPVLIDPATYYGHREVDIAMTRLFGGFEPTFYSAYAEHFPEVGGEKERSDLYQLYYLLVHLNLFGLSYKSSVMPILKRYF